MKQKHGTLNCRNHAEFFCVVTTCSIVAGCRHFRDPCCFGNFGILSQHCAESQSRRPWLDSPPPWKPQISYV